MNFLLVLFTIFLSLICAIKCDDRSNRVRRIVGGEPAAVPPEDDPVVFTRFAGKSARVQGVRDYPTYVFRGLRFGLPPIGKERFLRPRQYFLQGYENATKYPSPCVQPVPNQDMVIGSEDCLFLNVFTPVLPTGMEGLPVIVWIHGGGFRYGSASQYGVRHLVGKQVVVVTIQYRLGSLGFLSSDSKDLPGNAALWDMVLAVQWVRNYIGFFGGNPHKIVVMGHGSGASSAMLVALSNVAKGLSSGIVAMSGSTVSYGARDGTPRDTAKEIADQNGCPVSSPLTMVRCLQNLSPESVIRGDSSIEFQHLQNGGFVSGLSGRLGAAPVYEGHWDGRSLPPLVEEEPLQNLYLNSKSNKIPLLTGITKDETKRACQGHYQNEIVSKLKSIPNFLDNVLVKNLQNKFAFAQSLLNTNTNNSVSSPEVPNIWSLDPLQFRNYLQVQRNNVHEGVQKISEATGDALFNVPAFLTVDAWAKKGVEAFLYRFEHVGKRNKGHVFLRGLPLVGNSTQVAESNDTVGHGDELSYLFDAQDIMGRSLESSEPPTEEDDKVLEFFTQMVSDFARSGKISVGNEKVKPFSSSDNNFLQISSKPKMANNFRFCEMALWCGLAQRLQSSTCKFLQVVDAQLKNVQQLFDTSLEGTRGKLEESLGGVMKPIDIFNLNKGRSNNFQTNNNNNRNSNSGKNERRGGGLLNLGHLGGK